MPSNWMEWFAQRRKFFVALLGAAVGVITTMGWTDNKWAQLIITVATLLGLYAVPNKHPEAAVHAPESGTSPGV